MTRRRDAAPEGYTRTYFFHRGPVEESQVMGRLAIVVCVAFWQLPAIGYLTGVAGSAAISDVSGGGAIPILWSTCFVLAGIGMIGVFTTSIPTRQAQRELVVLVVFTVAMTVYLAAILERAQTLDGRLAIIALLGSMIVNCLGRAVLLIRQLVAVAAVKRGDRW